MGIGAAQIEILTNRNVDLSGKDMVFQPAQLEGCDKQMQGAENRARAARQTCCPRTLGSISPRSILSATD